MTHPRDPGEQSDRSESRRQGDQLSGFAWDMYGTVSAKTVTVPGEHGGSWLTCLPERAAWVWNMAGLPLWSVVVMRVGRSLLRLFMACAFLPHGSPRMVELLIW